MTTEIKNTRLAETINEIEGAVKTLKTDKTIKPREYVEISKIIEKGEKKIAKEFSKRIEQMKEMENELAILTEFADKMGYTLTVTDEVTEVEAETVGA